MVTLQFYAAPRTVLADIFLFRFGFALKFWLELVSAFVTRTEVGSRLLHHTFAFGLQFFQFLQKHIQYSYKLLFRHRTYNAILNLAIM